MDVARFLAPVLDGSISGVDLRNEPRFHAIERLMEPAARQSRVANGGTGLMSEDWNTILAEAEDLAVQGRDLRLLVIVARAMTGIEGFAGLAQGLDLITETLDQYWETLHPGLRDSPDSREAALRRINALRQLENGDNGLLGDLQLNVAINARGIGPISGQDLAASRLTSHQVLGNAPGLSQAERDRLVASHRERVNRVTAATRAMAAEEPEALEALQAGIDLARQALSRLEAKLTSSLGLANGRSERLADLSRFLDDFAATLAAAEATNRTDSEPTSPEAADPAADPTLNGGTAGGITSRDDVLRTLDAIIAFYQRTEPASPIPHLARRMRRMVPMDFMELVAELAPGGIKEFRNVAGLAEEKTK